MKKRAMILPAVLTAAVLAGGGYFPTDIGNRLTQTVSAAKKDSDKKDDTSESEGSVLDQATLMYQQYNYDEAIKLLKQQDDFDTNKDYMDLAAKCQVAKSTLVEYPLEQITHVFFHTLIDDTGRAFDGDSKSGNYNQVMTTVSEFNKIIQIMYDKGYVLVSPHDMATVNDDGTMSRGKIMVPEGKIPFVLSQDDVSYYHYMDGDGCASKLVLDENGEVKNEYVEADGSVFPCDFYMTDDYYIGNYNYDQTETIDEKRREIGFVARSTNISDECRECKFIKICRNGCQRCRDKDDITGKYRNYFCESYKMFFDECLDKMEYIASYIAKKN